MSTGSTHTKREGTVRRPGSLGAPEDPACRQTHPEMEAEAPQVLWWMLPIAPSNMRAILSSFSIHCSQAWTPNPECCHGQMSPSSGSAGLGLGFWVPTQPLLFSFALCRDHSDPRMWPKRAEMAQKATGKIGEGGCWYPVESRCGEQKDRRGVLPTWAGAPSTLSRMCT